ncbi:MAG: sensor histidine kinase, partial [Anaerolineae bacterium]|nr:sensor histidine kinase [Anaerolineae bacterium]
VEQAAVTERNRLAHDLHDAVSQSLFAASLIAEVLPAIWRANQEEGQKRLLELHELTKGALAEMRTILLTLRPAALAEMALKDAIQQLVDGGVGRMRLPIHASLVDTGKLPVEVKTTFYRITQEALNNVFKHAKATDIVVTLADAQDQIRLTIEDNGCGFDLSVRKPGHMGLDIMRERAAAAGVDLQLDSEPGRGTCLIAQWHKIERETRKCLRHLPSVSLLWMTIRLFGAVSLHFCMPTRIWNWSAKQPTAKKPSGFVRKHNLTW